MWTQQRTDCDIINKYLGTELQLNIHWQHYRYKIFQWDFSKGLDDMVYLTKTFHHTEADDMMVSRYFLRTWPFATEYYWPPVDFLKKSA